jgi:hypothetical protein
MHKFLIALFATAAAAADVQPGNWEMTVTLSVEGAPAGAVAPVTQTRCLSEADARDPSRLVGSAGCEFSNKQDNGSEMSFDVACGGQVPMRGKGVVRYGAQSVSGTLELSAEASGQKLATRSQLSARRLGDCKS